MAEAPRFQAPTGTQDVLPPESARWEALLAGFATAAGRAGYGLAVNPMFEDVGVFQRGIGEGTDVVTKEMYEFRDKGDRRLALRPEGTASVVRSFIQRHPPVPFKVWYATPAFRYERPQAGRYRQHHQIGVEALGVEDPDLDAEVIALAWSVYRFLGLSRVTLRVNSMGDGQCLPAYRQRLLDYLLERRDQLCDEHRQKVEANPLRVLDCKRSECVAVSRDAPAIIEHLCGPCREHLDRVLAGLQALGIAYEMDHRLVRGFDYYTRTTFEFSAEALDSAQNAIGGGGRYDGLVAELGGPDTPGIGFAMGIERLLLACDAEEVFPAPTATVDVFVVDVTGGTEAVLITHELRRAGLRADRAFDHRSMKSQMKAADRSGATVAVIVGEEEMAAGQVTLRSLREEGHQERVERHRLVEGARRLALPGDSES